MELIEKNKDQIIFSAEIEDSLANAIRRYVNHIPVLAVDELEISRNDSPLYDETVAHRVGLVPIKADKATEKSRIKGKQTFPIFLKVLHKKGRKKQMFL